MRKRFTLCILIIAFSSCIVLPTEFAGKDMTSNAVRAQLSWTDDARKAPGYRLTLRGQVYRKCSKQALADVLSVWIGQEVAYDSQDRNCWHIAHLMLGTKEVSALGNIAFGTIDLGRTGWEHRACILATGNDDQYWIVNMQYQPDMVVIKAITFTKWNNNWLLCAIDL